MEIKLTNALELEIPDHVEAANKAALDHLASGIERVEAGTYTYDCMLAIGAAAGGVVTVEFTANGATVAKFIGGFGGGFGGYLGWGKAWFNTPVEGLIGKSGALVVEVVGVLGGTGHVQITGDGFIGNCSTGGIGAGAGVGVGGGKFNAP